MGEDEAATEERKQEDLESVAVVIDGASVACVMYRSGRRGNPESIWLNQRMLCGTGALRVGEEDRVALRLSVEEEAGVLELLRVIAAGGCVLEMSKALVRAPRKMAEMLEEQGSTVVWGKGAELERLGREFAESLEQVRAVVCVEGWEGQRWAAEALPEELLERVYGTYGTVETGGAGVLYGLREMRGNGERAGIRMNGVAAGKRVYVLDGEMRGVPEGLVGEIYIGGEEQGLWRGDGEETAWSWVPDQWSERAGARLYRTGDLGRRRKDGVLEHVGRKDRQAMVGGVRVHEEEIEAVLRKTAGVAEAAVVIGVNGNKDGKLTGRTEITAWVERSDKITSQNGFFVEELLKEMKRELPEAMVPQRVIEVEEWPRRKGGEIDRGALARKLVQAAGETEYTPARTEEEARLVGIWEETLEKKPIGVHDSFFSIGGDSLLATQLVARMSAALEVELPLRRLFELPTIAQLAPVVTELKQKGGWRKPPIQKISRDGELELSFAQQRLWFLMQVMPGNTSYNIPMALRMRGELDLEALKRSIREIVRRHEVLRTRFETVNGRPRQIIEPEIDLDLEVVDLESVAAAERDEALLRLAVEEAQKPFDLEKGPMVRVGLVRVGEQDHALLMTMHHIVSDAVSTAVAVRELTALYAAYRERKESPLQELAIQYADYAAWQRGWLKGEVLEEQTAYWKQELGGVKALRMPTDRPWTAQTTAKSGFARFRMAQAETAKVKELSQREGVTMFMTLMAAFQVLLYRYSGQEDFAVGTPIAGRTATETEPLIGFFVNTLVLPAEVGGGPSFRQVLQRMKTKTMGAYAHQDVPFERLVDSLQIERNVNRSPLFQAMFAFQNAGLGAELDLGGGLKLEGLNVGTGMAAKFELLLAIGDVQDALVASMQYYAELFEEETMVVMMRRLEHLLEEVAENPQQSIDAVGLLSLAEREQLESGWSGPAVVQRVKETLPELVEYWAEQKPESTALVSGDGEELSYAELERASSLVSKRLRREGVRAGAVVGIWVEGMREWLIAAVGVLKAGGVFLPVEAAGPASRREQMLKDAGGAWVITEEELSNSQTANSGVKLLHVNALMEAAEEGRRTEARRSAAVNRW